MATWERFADFFGSYYTLFIAVVAHFNMFLTCLSFAWPSPVLPKLLMDENNPLGRRITPEEGDMLAAIFYIGAAAGPILFFGIVKKIGRRKVLIAISYVPAITYGTLVFADSLTLYNICRILTGVWNGLIFNVEPVYVSEILADEERSFLMSIVTIFGFSGVFFGVLVGPFVSIPVFNGLIASVSLVIALLMTFGFPESPFYLMKTKGDRATRDLLKKLRTREIDNEISEMSRIVANESRNSFFEIFGKVGNLKIIMFATVPLLLQSYSGIALILSNNQLIFMETNLAIPSEWCSIIVIGLTLSTTFFTPLFITQKVSIYTLLSLCLSGIATCNFIMSMYFMFGKSNSYVSWIPLVVLLCFLLIYNCGIDPIPWMIMGQAYPLSIREEGTALTTSIFKLSIFPSLLYFHEMELSTLFLISSVVSLFGVFYVRFIVVPHMERKEENQKA